VAAFAGVLVTAAAGNWQLNRADEKERLQAAYDQGEAAAPVALSAEPESADRLRLRRVKVEGEFVASAMVLLDNKVYRKTVGYQVIMPLRIRDSPMHVLVNRGWIAAGTDRQQLPLIPTPTGTVTVSGVAVLPGRFLELGQIDVSGPVWQNLTIERFRDRWGLDLQPLVIEQVNDLDDGLVRDWPRPDFGIAKHYGYAVQWFSLCALIIFLYLFFHVRRSRSEEDKKDASAAGHD
jgi:surfeit locus 1 family protein